MKLTLSVGLFLLASAASAQMTTLDYTGPLMTGTTSSLTTGATPTNGGLSYRDFSGYFTAQVVIEGSLSRGLTLESYSFGVIANGSPLAMNGVDTPFGGSDIFPQYTDNGGPVRFSGVWNSITLTQNAQGSFTGAYFSINDPGIRGGHLTYHLGPTGDSVDYLPVQRGFGDCRDAVQYGQSPYPGPSVSLCTVNASTAKAGTWTVTTAAPEIDASLAASGLTLLLGGLAVLRGRRKFHAALMSGDASEHAGAICPGPIR